MGKILLLLGLLNLFPCLSAVGRYVWIDSVGKGMNQYVYFRKEIQVESLEQVDAEINLYAFSRYALYINDEYVNFGPVRSYPKHPYYDTFDLSSYLRKGKNVIAVKVMNNGMETFQLPYSGGAFIAWGNVMENGKNTDTFDTPGDWFCRLATGYLRETPRFSFAKGPVEVFDATLEPDDWKGNHVDITKWKNPKLLSNTDLYGKMLPRPIPYLTQDEYTPLYLINQFGLADENIYNVHAVSMDTLHIPGRKDTLSYKVRTWIYAPEESEIEGGLSLGDYLLNGSPLHKTIQGSGFRIEYDFPMRKGWNLLEGRLRPYSTAIDFMLSFPVEKGILVSHDKSRDGAESLLFGPENNMVVYPARNPVSNPSKFVSWRRSLSKDPVDFFDVANRVIPAGQDKAMVYDMGQMMLGRIFVEVDAPYGTLLDISFSEDEKDGKVTLYKRNQINATVRFVSDGKTRRFETFKPYGARFLQLNVSGHNKPVSVHKIGMVSQIYPHDKLGAFQCSDYLLNRIWEMGWRTIRICSEDSYIDTPFRERGHYAGDLYPEYAITAVTSGDTRLLKHTIRVIADMYEKVYKHEETAALSDYPLFNFMIATWYIRQYEDVGFAREIYPIYASFMDKWWEKRRSDGLFYPGKVFFEWTQIDKNALLSSYQVMMAACYEDLSYLSGLIGREEEIDRYNIYSDSIKQVINDTFWNEEKGIYYDGKNEEGYLRSAYPNSSAFALIWSVSDEERTEKCLEYMEKVLLDIGEPVNRHQLSSPYGGFYALAALYKYGRAGLAEQYIRKYWGRMIYEGDDTAWEDFNRDNHSTMSHAWSASPTYYLSTQVLGVDMGFPLYSQIKDTIRIAPQSETLSWAKGCVPHPAGLVYVKWEVKGNILFLDYYTSSQAKVIIEPRGRLGTYELKISRKDKPFF